MKMLLVVKNQNIQKGGFLYIITHHYEPDSRIN